MYKFTSFLVMLAFCIPAAYSFGYILEADVIDGGGTKMTSASHILRGSVAQSTIGKISSSSYTAYIGFWHPPYAVGPGIAEDIAFYRSFPSVFSLSQNFPNPVVNSTTIKYSLPREGLVDVRVFNNAGQEIRTLVSETQRPGFYSIRWDLKSVSGEDLPNGVYFYRMRAGGFTSSRKLVLLR